MGEYEPHDSRDVTLSGHQAPGEPPRTGPREDAARAEAERRAPSGDDQPADDDRMAIENDTGIARPEYDQYALNDPQSLDKDGRGRGDERVTRAADDV